MNRSDIAKLESYREQRDFELSGKSSLKSFLVFQESFLYSSNERHIQRLELIDKHRNSLLVKIIGANLFIDPSKIIGTASFSDDYLIEKIDDFDPGICSNCINYHGVLYGKARLICAIYPDGFNHNYCPDYSPFEKVKQ
ncbi:hypothetical protein [Nostoc sp. FACHB-280]|uniref:hypothetical protein n=1 Tax=Nostoc sp. FACHB-280 TaxID=2692839 RepID=UPI00168A8372|nr:hypothetical protein [Nostoc sp. FACHB-280]MBD2498965.1 hypothetical protein [Nostoc sp. FACHB-280]